MYTQVDKHPGQRFNPVALNKYWVERPTARSYQEAGTKRLVPGLQVV